MEAQPFSVYLACNIHISEAMDLWLGSQKNGIKYQSTYNFVNSFNNNAAIFSYSIQFLGQKRLDLSYITLFKSKRKALFIYLNLFFMVLTIEI